MAQEIELDPNDLDLEFVREKRKLLINHYLKDDKPPEDPKEAALLIGMLGDMDRIALGKKRIKVEKESNATAAHAVELIAQLFSNTDVKKIGVDLTMSRTNVPELEHRDDILIIPGECEVVAAPEDYDSFIKKNNYGT